MRFFLTNQRSIHKSKWMLFYCHCWTDLNSAYLTLIHHSIILKVLKGDFNWTTRFRYSLDKRGCLQTCSGGSFEITFQKCCWKWTVRNKYNISRGNKSVPGKKFLIPKPGYLELATFVPLRPLSRITLKKRRIFYCGTLRRFISRRVTMPNCNKTQIEFWQIYRHLQKPITRGVHI